MLSILIFSLLTVQGAQQIVVENPWLRPGAKGGNSALYFKIFNHGDKADTLYKVSCPAAGLVQIHETFHTADMMGMKEVEQVIIEPHSSFEFKPGGHHVMLMKLKQNLKKSSEAEIILFLKNAGQINIRAKVKR